MLPPNTVEILKNLNKDELKKLSDFIRSPYFNTKESLHHLTNEIVKRHPEFKPEKFDYKKIYKKIYGADDYKEQTIRNLYSEFGVLLKRFVAYERLESYEPDFNRALISGLRDKNCYELSNRTISKLNKELMSSFISEEDYYYEMYYLNHIFRLNLNSVASKFDVNSAHKATQELMDNLSKFYLSSLFFFAEQETFLIKAYKPKEIMHSMQEALLKLFEEGDFFKPENDTFNTPFLKIRYLCYKYSAKDITEKDYKELEKLVIDNIEKFTIHFRVLCWATLLTLILWKLVPQDKKHYRDAFQLNDYFSKLELFPNKTNIFFSTSLFRNAFDTSLTLKEYNWSRNFIEKFAPFLEEDMRENEVNYALGQLNFKLKKYEESISFMNKVIYTTVREKINVRFYYLMNYIELKSYQPAISMLNTIKQFQSESKEISKLFSELIDPSIKFFREIIKAEENKKKLDYAILKEAENAGRYYHKQYTLEKIKQLI